MENLDLQEIRKKLDGIDNQLVELFEKRMALCSDVAEFKIQTGKKVYDGERERQKLDSVMAMADSEFNKKGVYPPGRNSTSASSVFTSSKRTSA